MEVLRPIIFDSFMSLPLHYPWIYDLSMRYGRTFRVVPGWQQAVYYTSDPLVVEHILKDNFENYTKRSNVIAAMKDLLGGGIFIADHGHTSADGGEGWKMQRKTAAQIFTTTNFKGFMERTFTKHGQELLQILGRHARDKDCFDVQSLFFKLTLDSIGVLGFGVDLGTMQREDVPFVQAFDRVQVNSMQRLFSPVNMLVQINLPYEWYPWAMQYLLWLLPRERQIAADIAVLDAFALKVIHKRRDAIKAAKDAGGDSPGCSSPCRLGQGGMGNDRPSSPRAHLVNGALVSPRGRCSSAGNAPGSPGRRRIMSGDQWQEWRGSMDGWSDFLSLFLDAGDRDKMEVSDAFLRDVLMSFVIAGRDTTASTLSWLFLLLGQHEEEQALLLEELEERLGDRQPNFTDVNQSSMPYLNACVWEALRLFPPVAGDAKYAAHDDTLPDGTFVAAGSEMNYMPFVMGRDPAVWPDAESFKPSRWIPFARPSQYALPIFQAGPRICLGMEMALFEVKLIAAMVLQKFKLTLADPQQSQEYQLGLTICVKGGLRVYAMQR